MQTIRPISAAMASSMDAAATDGGTNIALHISRVSYSVSATMPFPYNGPGIIREEFFSCQTLAWWRQGRYYLASAVEK